ncbi:MAG TPA: hypothetical protein VNH80_01870, partial [Burkholderiales bacterium]|nr:hypothetical protein [Burkholderiales bacterium]
MERELVDRAVIPEIADSYVDVWGETRAIAPQTRDALSRALGNFRKPRSFKIARGACHEPAVFDAAGRVWGF